MLRRNEHQPVEVLIGSSEMRRIPDYFFEQINAPVLTYESPNFLKTADNKHFRIFRSFVYNLKRERRKAYFAAMRLIRERIDTVKPDVVVNFCELLCGSAYRRYDIRTPLICIAHQFVFEHPAYKFSHRLNLTQRLLRLHTRLSASGAYRRLALSYTPMPDVPQKKLYAVPPLLRCEIRHLQPQKGSYVLGYILNHGFEEEIAAWHARRPEVAVHVFWDKPDAPETYALRSNLTFHRPNDRLFLTLLAGCAGFFATAGFESVCEALYLNKPVLIVPAHAEQTLNADDALRTGSVIAAATFDLDPLIDRISGHEPDNAAFRDWVDGAEKIVMRRVVP
jgi:uncharacterized protein (TIGR00661 family)